MKIEVRVFSGLENYIPGARFGKPMPIEIADRFTARMLLEKLNIPEKEVFTILVNGSHKGLDDVLCNGDRVSLFPPVGGG
ncbi:MAG: MoaD/ThiS family protein [Pelotomaculaceae bacterium]|nr:MoaD/ThiS family protein [Bacillota bacterium]HHU85437.1 MoaD/ThiS family protein [Peptococcaceae bacterium]